MIKKVIRQGNPLPFSHPQIRPLGLTKFTCVASLMAFSMNSSVILRLGCSLKTEFMRAIRAALRRASAFVGQF